MTRLKPAKKTVIIYSAVMLLLLGFVAGALAYQEASVIRVQAEEAGISSPAFSRESGFYDAPFMLSMEADEGCEIYYTLDGSTPDENAIRYEKPLQIKDASGNENVYSARTDTSTGFYEDLIEKHSGRLPPRYAVPDEPVDKCTVIKAVAVNEDGLKSRTSCGSYFVGLNGPDYEGCEVISLMIDPVDLFDYDTGIYVTGKAFDDYEITEGITWARWRANYRMKGEDWVRDARIQLFDSKSRTPLEKTCKVSIKGDVTRGYSQKSFRLSFLDEEGNPGTLGRCLFGGTYDPEHIILNAGGNKVITKFSDYAISDILGTDRVMKHYRPAVVFLDGEYWGFYWICEDLDKDWYEYYFRTDRENIVAVSYERTGETTYAVLSEDPRAASEEQQLFKRFTQFFKGNDMADPDNYEQACELIDMDEYIDYFATEIYLANHDWPKTNKIMWRAYKPSDSEDADGKWRFLFYDMDLITLPEHLNSNTLANARKNDAVFDNLMGNAEFREQFRKRIFEIADQYFEPDAMDAYIDDYCAQYGSALEKSWTRYFDPKYKDKESFMENMEFKKEFFKKRRAVVEQWFEQEDR